MSALVARGAASATICPCEVARAIARDWRSLMATLHAGIDGLMRDRLGG